MDHLLWIVFDLAFGLFNGYLAVNSYRKGKRVWFVLQVVCTILLFMAAVFNLGLLLRG